MSWSSSVATRFRIDHSIHAVHHNSDVVSLEALDEMAGGARLNDIHRASSLSVRLMSAEHVRTGFFPYHRLVASCTFSWTVTMTAEG